MENDGLKTAHGRVLHRQAVNHLAMSAQCLSSRFARCKVKTRKPPFCPALIHKSSVFRVFTRHPNGVALECGRQTAAFFRRSPASAGPKIKRKFRLHTPKRQYEEVKIS